MKPNELRKELDIELSFIQQTVSDAVDLLPRVGNGESTVYDRAAAGMLLAQFYNGVENILKRISKYCEVPLPSGPGSHAMLFRAFCDPPHASFPILFPGSVEENFVILRRFRHFVHHSYAFELDWERLKAGIGTLEQSFQVFKEQVIGYLDKLGE